MTARGWCPGLYDPMPSGDGLLVRLKPPGGRLDAAALRAVAAAMAAHGSGIAELTQRGILQIRGLSSASVAPFAAAMVAAGLASADPVQERRRRLILAPPVDAGLIEAMQMADPAWDVLPEKFCCSVNSMAGDIHVCGAETGIGGALVTGTPPLLAIPLLTAACLALGGERMAALRSRLGEAAIFAAAGLPTRPLTQRPAPAAGLGVPFGVLDGAMLEGLAGFGAVWLTPDRALLPEWPDAALAVRLGLITDPEDRRRSVFACVGQPGCASASVPARADAAWFAQRPGPALHVAGCAKGCAHPGAAAVTLVGNGGRYDLVLAGKAGDPPIRRGLTREAAAAWLA